MLDSCIFSVSSPQLSFYTAYLALCSQAVEGVVDQFKLLATSEKSESDRVRAVQSEEGHLRAAVTFEDPQLNLYVSSKHCFAWTLPTT